MLLFIRIVKLYSDDYYLYVYQKMEMQGNRERIVV